MDISTIADTLKPFKTAQDSAIESKSQALKEARGSLYDLCDRKKDTYPKDFFDDFLEAGMKIGVIGLTAGIFAGPGDMPPAIYSLSRLFCKVARVKIDRQIHNAEHELGIKEAEMKHVLREVLREKM